jgi:hypothetical protein
VANEVAFEYGAWGAVTKSMQDHAAAARYARLEKITLPGGRQVYYNHETGGQFGS